MNYLIGDIGNTSIKICKINRNFKITKTFLFNSKDSNLEKNIKKKLNKLLDKNTFKKILFSSVVPKVYKKMYKILSKKNIKFLK